MESSPSEGGVGAESSPEASDVETLRVEQERLQNALKRSQADLINYRQRMEKERAEFHKYANQRLLARLLPILDEFALALEKSGGGAASDSWLEGFRLLDRKLNNLMEMEGVELIDALGKPFDPFEHEALSQQQTDDMEDGSVLLVVRNGYKLDNRVLRPAQVVVAVNDGSVAPGADAAPVSES